MDSTRQPFTIPLWAGAAPGSEHWTHEMRAARTYPSIDVRVERNIVRPELIVYLPEPAVANGTAVVVCPGGAFHFLAIDHEGHDVARWLNQRGIAAFILRYRVIPTAADDDAFVAQLQDNMANRERMWQMFGEYAPLSIADGHQAIRVARRHAAEWGVTPEKIGIMGFSAGGVVTTGVAAGYDAASRPAFAAPIYPAPWDVGDIPADAPPLFLAMAADDAMAVDASLPLFRAWLDAGHSAELHIYATGGHGFGMNHHGVPSDSWIERFGDWLAALH